MYASLFDVRNGEHGKVTEFGRFRATAPGHGVPPQPSQWYREERDTYRGAVGETWVLWSELAAIDWDEKNARRERRGDYLIGGWATLFKLMEVLAEQFGADNVRLSVWFDQWTVFPFPHAGRGSGS